MTPPSYVVGIPLVAPGHGAYRPGSTRNRVVSLVHAVRMPVADNPAESLCGLLVIATVDSGWSEVWGAPRCAACLRISG